VEPWGDRQIELVFIGYFNNPNSNPNPDPDPDQSLKHDTTSNIYSNLNSKPKPNPNRSLNPVWEDIKGLFNSCLLTDEEFNMGQDVWNNYDDPLPWK
jgi:hypothetical protein